MNLLSANSTIQENCIIKYHSKVLETRKINQNLKHPIKNKEIHLRFIRACTKLKGVLLWMSILSEVRTYGTNSHLFDSFDRYRNDLITRFKPKKRKFFTKTEKTIDFGYLISPESIVCQIWNCIVLVMLLYVFIVMPWVMAFEDVAIANNWFIAETFIDVLCFLDILVTLNTAYYDIRGRIVANRKKIFLNYLKGFMIIDIISITPFYLLEQGTIIKSNALLRIVRITSITRVLRGSKIVKLIKYLKHSESIANIIKFMKLYRGVIRLLLLLFSVLVMSHFVACMFYYTAKLDGYGPYTWVVRYDLQDSPKETKYLKSLYFTITILTTVGFGDIVPYTASEMILCIAWMSLGIGFYSTIVSTISSVFSSMDSRRVMISEKISDLDKLGKYYDVKKDSLKYLKKKVSDNIIFNKKIGEYEKQKIVKELPRKIQINIVKNIYNSAASKLRFFKNKDTNFLIDIMPMLRHMVIQTQIIIYNKHDFPESVYFIIEGKISYVLGSKNFQFKSIVSGSYFGEIEILMNQPRKFTVITENVCEMLVMPSGVLDDIMAKYPVIADEIWVLAKKRDQKNLECYRQVVEILDKVEIKKEASLDQLAGRKCSNKDPKKKTDPHNMDNQEIEESIAQDLYYIEQSLHTIRVKMINKFKL